MKNIYIIIFFVLQSLINFEVLANIEKGKWNFVKDSDYCYIGSLPINSEIPEGKTRDDPYILVYRINKNPEPIIQIYAGYNYKKNVPVKVKIDKKIYEFFSEDDSAWTEDDNSIIYAMKMGIDLVITGISSRTETKTIDTYTLKGFTAAFNKLTKDC
tara:strand:+ start:290 stop:760 length:471 start_codon:yes stop_codon:yes gene_type:complete